MHPDLKGQRAIKKISGFCFNRLLKPPQCQCSTESGLPQGPRGSDQQSWCHIRKQFSNVQTNWSKKCNSVYCTENFKMQAIPGRQLLLLLMYICPALPAQCTLLLHTAHTAFTYCPEQPPSPVHYPPLAHLPASPSCIAQQPN